jgi:hypothetical protein
MDKSVSVEEFFANIYVPFDTEFFVAQWDDESAQVFLTELYHILYTRQMQTVRVANWTYSRGFSWSSLPLFARRKDMQGIVLKAALIPHVCNSYVLAYFTTPQNRRELTFLSNSNNSYRSIIFKNRIKSITFIKFLHKAN